MDVETIITAAIAGAIGALSTGVIAPWVRWRIEKRRKRLHARRDLIAQGRKLVSNMAVTSGDRSFLKPIRTRLCGNTFLLQL
jgi:hypothetical protein